MMKSNKHLAGNGAITSGNHFSFWTDTVTIVVQNSLKEHLETDVVIIGAGIAGLSTAYCLAQSGKKVVVIEDGFIGSGETGRTTAQLVTALDNRYYDLERIFGEEKTRLIAESHIRAIDFVEETVKKENIVCGFERINGYLFLHPTDKKDSLERELKAAKRAGVEVKEVDHAPGLLADVKALCFQNQAQFHPLQYLKGLTMAIEKMGGQIFINTHAAKIDHEGIVSTRGFRVKAKHVVVATNTPVNNLFMISGKQFAFRTYVIGALVKKGFVPKALWWDTGDFEKNSKTPPYHYVRVYPYNDENDLLISGGEDHPTANIEKRKVKGETPYKLLEDWTRNKFPIGKVVYQWSGQVMEPMDGLAFIGRNPLDHDNVYVITGDSGNGMTHCSFAGLLISDLINGKENKWEKLYSPARFTIQESGQAVKQIVKEVVSYIKQIPNFNGLEILSSIKKGEGKIVNMLEEKFGAYRHENDSLYIVPAECTHLKCTLIWNQDELSWDCPCHGSRFTFEGKVINGPANFDLEIFDENTISQR